VTFEEPCEKIRATRTHWPLASAATEDEIVAAEAKLGRFPELYRLLLKELGDIGFGIYGVGPEMEPYQNIVTMNRHQREYESPPMPSWLVAIRNNGGGSNYCFDNRLTAGASDSPIYYWSEEEAPDQVLEEECANFEALVLDFASYWERKVRIAQN
jgi:SMI1-KNR4 cell-wall